MPPTNSQNASAKSPNPLELLVLVIHEHKITNILVAAKIYVYDVLDLIFNGLFSRRHDIGAVFVKNQ